MREMNKKTVFVLLHNIRSVHNVGSMFRTADALGVSKIFLSGFTPAPVDRFGNPRKDFIKVSLGAEKTVPWEYHKTPNAIIERFKKERIQIIAVEQDARSIDYRTVSFKSPAAFLVGNEGRGLSKNLLNKADVIAEIPMSGRKESLNVSVSFAVAVFRILDR